MTRATQGSALLVCFTLFVCISFDPCSMFYSAVGHPVRLQRPVRLRDFGVLGRPWYFDGLWCHCCKLQLHSSGTPSSEVTTM
ncbi:hypothetical protein COO60DRAFT_1486822 [Scenedesmus sp. NREL 46B-D3]|nr:hypothetical protein COO60DRAFT_1486822 [Scenedesmus sp. NREL 46B-D3]